MTVSAPRQRRRSSRPTALSCRCCLPMRPSRSIHCAAGRRRPDRPQAAAAGADDQRDERGDLPDRGCVAIGIAAPVIVILLRLVQGFAMERRESLPGLGMVVRVLRSILVLAVGLFVRINLFEMPEFERIRDTYHLIRLLISIVTRPCGGNVLLGLLARMGEGGVFTVFNLIRDPLPGYHRRPAAHVSAELSHDGGACVHCHGRTVSDAGSCSASRHRQTALPPSSCCGDAANRRPGAGGRSFQRCCHRHPVDAGLRTGSGTILRAVRHACCWSPGATISRGVRRPTCCSPASAATGDLLELIIVDRQNRGEPVALACCRGTETPTTQRWLATRCP